MKKSIMIIAEQQNGEIKKSSYEIASEGKKIADALDISATLVLIGDQVKDKAVFFYEYGIARVLVADHPELNDYNNEVYASIVENVAKENEFSHLIMSATAQGKDLAATLAGRFGVGLAQDCTELSIASGKLIATKVAPVSATARALTDQATSELLEALLRNIYGAFDFRDDSDVYDALATSVEGALLRELYLRVKRSLVMAEQGGALSHVDKVEILSVTPPTAGTTPTTEATWRVAGTVEHWGHVHTRVNEYRGRVSVVLDEGTWKLQALQLLGEKRIKFETRIRGYDRD